MSQPKIVIVGQVCIDHNETEQAAYTKWGSTALYMADYCQQHLGTRPYVITTFGPDFAPYAKDFRLYPDTPTADATLIYKNIITPDSRQWFCEHEASAVPPVLTEKACKIISDADILVLAALMANYPSDYVQKIFSLAKPGCLKVLTAQGYLRQKDRSGKILPRDFSEHKDLLPLFDLTVYSSEDHPKGIAMAKEWLKLPGVKDIVVTKGPKGACLVDISKTTDIPTESIAEEDIVDSVGCGDIFAMALAYNYFLSKDLVSATKAAHRAAQSKLLGDSAKRDITTQLPARRSA